MNDIFCVKKASLFWYSCNLLRFIAFETRYLCQCYEEVMPVTYLCSKISFCSQYKSSCLWFKEQASILCYGLNQGKLTDHETWDLDKWCKQVKLVTYNYYKISFCSQYNSSCMWFKEQKCVLCYCYIQGKLINCETRDLDKCYKQVKLVTYNYYKISFCSQYKSSCMWFKNKQAYFVMVWIKGN